MISLANPFQSSVRGQGQGWGLQVQGAELTHWQTGIIGTRADLGQFLPGKEGPRVLWDGSRCQGREMLSQAAILEPE